MPLAPPPRISGALGAKLQKIIRGDAKGREDEGREGREREWRREGEGENGRDGARHGMGKEKGKEEGEGKGERGYSPPPTLIPGAATDLTGLSLERRCDKACWACRHIDKA